MLTISRWNSASQANRRLSSAGVAMLLGIGLLFCVGHVLGAEEASAGAVNKASVDAPQSFSSGEPESGAQSGDSVLDAPQVVGDSRTATDRDLGNTDDGRQQVSVAGVEATWSESGNAVEVSALVTDYVGEGICKITLADPTGYEIVQDVVAVADAQTTLCPRTIIDLPSTGVWTVNVAFSNVSHVGVSGNVSLTSHQ